MKNYITFSIFLELLRNDTVPAKDLAQKFEISTRTIYRYISELESAGIPTFSKRGKNGGVGIEKEFCLDALTLTHEEKMVLKQSLYDSQRNTFTESLTYQICETLMKKFQL